MIETDVLVIGSGAGGALTAATLAEAGRSVLIVEEGPQADAQSMQTHRARAMLQLYRHGGLSPILGNASLAYTEGRCVGGSTEINSAFWHRPPEEAIRRWRERFRVRDLSVDELQQLAETIERELPTSTVGPAREPRSSQLFRTGAERLGWNVQQIPRAQTGTLESSPFASGGRRSMSRTYVPKACAAGARLTPRCQVTRLHHRRGRVSHVSAAEWDGDRLQAVTIKADTVFVCGGPVQTPKLLRASGITRNVGNTLRLHPMLKVAALFDETLDSDAAALPLYQVKEFWPHITLGGSVFSPGFLALTLSDNWNANEAALRDWRRMALLYTACRGTNCGTIRVVPGTGEPLVRYRISAEDQMNLTAGAARLTELLFEAGARVVYPGVRGCPVLTPENWRPVFDQPLPISAMSLMTVHAFSSCPMGENNALCASDSFGRVHGFQNLYLADASILPDSPGVNPQGTIMVMALRNARRFLARS